MGSAGCFPWYIGVCARRNLLHMWIIFVFSLISLSFFYTSYYWKFKENWDATSGKRSFLCLVNYDGFVTQKHTFLYFFRLSYFYLKLFITYLLHSSAHFIAHSHQPTIKYSNTDFHRSLLIIYAPIIICSINSSDYSTHS